MVVEYVQEVDRASVDARTFRLPRRYGSEPVDRFLADANEISRARALEAAGSLVPSLRLADNAQDVDGARFEVTSGARVAEYVDGLVLLDDLLRRFDHGDDLLKVVLDTVRVPRDYYSDVSESSVSLGRSNRLASLVHLMADGHTIVIDGVDMRDPSVARLALMFERIFGSRLNINAYIGYLPSDAFGFHWDDHEVVILPLYGRKHWEICRPRDLSMTKATHGPDCDTSTIVWSGILGPGQVAYIPRGWSHRARGKSELTVHLTVSIKRTSITDVVRTAACESDGRERELSSPMALIDEGCLEACSRDLLTYVKERFESSCAEQVARQRFHVPSRRLGRLSVMATNPVASPLWLTDPHGGGWLCGGSFEGRVEIGAGGRSWLCSRAAVEVLAAVSRRSPVLASSLVDGGLDPELVAAVAVSGIVDAGVEAPNLVGRLAGPL